MVLFKLARGRNKLTSHDSHIASATLVRYKCDALHWGPRKQRKYQVLFCRNSVDCPAVRYGIRMASQHRRKGIFRHLSLHLYSRCNTAAVRTILLEHNCTHPYDRFTTNERLYPFQYKRDCFRFSPHLLHFFFPHQDRSFFPHIKAFIEHSIHTSQFHCDCNTLPNEDV